MVEEKKAEAARLHSQGYNCAQSVLMAFAPELGQSPEMLATMAVGLGGGVGGLREVCGVVSAIALSEGLRYGGHPQRKGESYKRVQQWVGEFGDKNDGCLRCRDLKDPSRAKSCNALIAEGVEILHDKLCKNS